MILRRRELFGLLALAALVAILAVACDQPTDTVEGTDGLEVTRLEVATTVSPITSLAENIGGTRISLQGIVPEGTDSHTFEPAPSVAVILSQADLLIANGLFLEGPTIDLFEATRKETSHLLLLADNTIGREEWQFDFEFPEEDGVPNPHLWLDPLHALRYAELIKDELTRLDPDGAEYFQQNFDELAARINALDAVIRDAVATIPEQQRVLLTYHDSWPYFAQRYGMTVLGAVQPADFTQPSAGEVASVITQIREQQVPAIFGSELFPSPVMEQIASESGAVFVDGLEDDDLPGGDRHSYLGLMVQNMEIMIPALGGDASGFAAIDTTLVFEGDRTAVYP